MQLVEIDKSNYQDAIKIQRSIFPSEDGSLNILASVDRELFQKASGYKYPNDHVKYFLAELNDEYIGITGIYHYDFDPESAWLGWYGILGKYRKRGLGRKLLEKTELLAKNKGFKYLRLYTDSDENREAVKLYEKVGFVGEKYTVESLDYDCWIYSKSLLASIVPKWNNRNLNLSYQSFLDQMDSNQIDKIIKEFNELL